MTVTRDSFVSYFSIADFAGWLREVPFLKRERVRTYRIGVSPPFFVATGYPVCPSPSRSALKQLVRQVVRQDPDRVSFERLKID
jgi:hypothetical protein